MITAEKLQGIEAAFHVDEAALASAEAQLRTINETAEQTWGPVIGREARRMGADIERSRALNPTRLVLLTLQGHIEAPGPFPE